MGTLTLADFRSELVFLLRNRADAAVTGATGLARLDRWTNWAYRHASLPTVFEHREHQVRVDITLAQDDFDYSISQTTLTMKLLRIDLVTYVDAAAFSFTAQKSKLRGMSTQEFFRRTWSTASRPTHYTVRGEMLYIAPGPNATAAGNLVSLQAYRQPAPFVLTTDTTVLTDWWDEVILKGAQWRAERDLQYLELAEQTKQDTAALLNDAGANSTAFFTSADTLTVPGIVNAGTAPYMEQAT